MLDIIMTFSLHFTLFSIVVISIIRAAPPTPKKKAEHGTFQRFFHGIFGTQLEKNRIMVDDCLKQQKLLQFAYDANHLHRLHAIMDGLDPNDLRGVLEKLKAAHLCESQLNSVVESVHSSEQNALRDRDHGNRIMVDELPDLGKGETIDEGGSSLQQTLINKTLPKFNQDALFSVALSLRIAEELRKAFELFQLLNESFTENKLLNVQQVEKVHRTFEKIQSKNEREEAVRSLKQIFQIAGRSGDDTMRVFDVIYGQEDHNGHGNESTSSHSPRQLPNLRNAIKAVDLLNSLSHLVSDHWKNKLETMLDILQLLIRPNAGNDQHNIQKVLSELILAARPRTSEDRFLGRLIFLAQNYINSRRVGNSQCIGNF